jgi:hypothetical protein
VKNFPAMPDESKNGDFIRKFETNPPLEQAKIISVD